MSFDDMEKMAVEAIRIAGRKINNNMGKYVAEQTVIRAGKVVNKCRILVLEGLK